MSEESTLKRTRASGEVLDLLLREFELNHNPLPTQRKDISERTNMLEKAVRIWFQNRRAKLRKFERLGKSAKLVLVQPTQAPPSGHLSSLNLATNLSAAGLRLANIPIELNEKYCFVDCSSLSVGLWQRIKSGRHDQAALESSLVNLSPFTVNSVMSNVDLMVMLLRKNLEINYFFLAISNNAKILFRIFYPILAVVLCLLVDNNINKDDNELRLHLARRPKFSVYFFNGVNANLNQWLICDDFSEGQQVSSAFYAAGGTSTPHVLVGVKNSLQFLNSFILEHNLYSVPSLPNDTPTLEYPLQQIEGANNNFQIKHDVHTWVDAPRSDLDYSLKVGSPAANYDGQLPASLGSHVLARNPSYSGKALANLADMDSAPKKEFDLFSTDTPDFFSTVQTPTNLISHSADDNLLHSPSTNVHTFSSLDKSAAPRTEPRQHYEKQYDGEVEQPIYNDASSEHHYGFDMHGSDFQPNDLIVNSPALSHGEPTPNTSASGTQVDNFIDYNGHY